MRSWFSSQFERPTAPQEQGWRSIFRGQHTLIAAPTGSGKTLSAFMVAIDALVQRHLGGGLPDQTLVLYISPLKALSNDIQRNLQVPLVGIADRLVSAGLDPPKIRTFVRTGDTTQRERRLAIKRPPHIVVTTPESLYILLTSKSGRLMLSTVETVIIDEIHALVESKRGSHLALSLERLNRITTRPLLRIGLSATQHPIETVAHFLVGGSTGEVDCQIVDCGHKRQLDLAIEMPKSPIEPIMANEVWQEIFDRLAELIRDHHTTLVFVNTRRLAERVAASLAERLGKEALTSHHGSLSKEHRFDAEQRLKTGQLRALVATASLELGIDVGDVDLVCQIGSTRRIATFLQRVGRSGHQVGAIPKGRLFPLSRDELVEAAALFAAVHAGDLDRLVIPPAPLDILAQQLIAEVASDDCDVDDLYRCFVRAYPYRNLALATFEQVLEMVSEGYSTRRGRRGAYVHYDQVNRRLRPRKGARLAAITSGGAIPENADYDVLAEPNGTYVGSINEDFAIESLSGDIFQLGNMSWRILRVERGRVRVEDARGLPPTMPFWLGEAPARSAEFSAWVARLRGQVADRLAAANPALHAYLSDETAGIDVLEPLVGDDSEHRLQTAPVLNWLSDLGVCRPAAEQLISYLAASTIALRGMPTQQTLIIERFFDETGGMQLVVHSPFGSRLNRAWGLSLRKKFCRHFNFELQAAATEDAIVLSLVPWRNPQFQVDRCL